MSKLSAWIALFGLWLLACAIPSANDIHLSECIRMCNAASDACFEFADAACPDAGECPRQPFQDCGHDLIDCLAACVEETEEALQE